MARFNKFPTREGGGGGGSAVAAGGGPYGALTGVSPSNLDSANFTDVSGYPVDDTTVKSIDLGSYGGVISAHQGLNSAGAAVWTVNAASLSAATGGAINRISRPCWDGVSSDYYLLCAPVANTPIYTVAVDIATGAQVSKGSFAPVASILASTYINHSIDIDGSGNIYFMSFGVSGTNVAHIINSSSGASISEIDVGDVSGNTVAAKGGIYNKIVYGIGATTNNLFVINMETGSVNTSSSAVEHTAFLAPFENGQKWGELYMGNLGNSANAGVSRPPRWGIAQVQPFFNSLAKVFAVDGGLL